jgi:hypothetical protein
MYRAKIIKNDIKTLPFEEIVSVVEIEPFVTKYGIQKSWSWLGPQLFAHLGAYKLPELKNGMYDPVEFLKINIRDNFFEEGLWYFLVKSNRSMLMKGMTSQTHLPVCSLVPFYLAAQKQYNNISYSSWDRTKLSILVDKNLMDVIDTPKVEITADEILYARDLGSGQYDLTSYNRLVGIKDTALGKFKAMTQAVLAQIWCAHPVNRHKYMILDPWDLDLMPEPLVPSEVLTSSSVTLPWEQKSRTKTSKESNNTPFIFPWENENV